jgi:hypothetical protein
MIIDMKKLKESSLLPLGEGQDEGIEKDNALILITLLWGSGY